MIKVVIKNGLDNKIINMLTGLSILEVEELRKEYVINHNKNYHGLVNTK